MSRIGKLPVILPAGVTVEIAADNTVSVKGPLGTLSQKVDSDIKVEVGTHIEKDSQKEVPAVIVTRPTNQPRHRSLHGLYRALINNMVVGVTDGFSKTLQENPYLWDSFEDLVDLGLGGTIYYTSDASVVPKGSYEFARFSLDLSGNALSIFDKWLPIDGATGKHHFLGLPYKQYVKAAVSAGTTARFGRNNGHALAVRVEAGIGKAYGNSTAMPFEKQFYAGGASSMRGWQVRTLGPGFNKMDDSFIIPSQTGDLKLEMDIEYRFNMFWKLEGALFAEAGNIWLLNEINRFEDIGPESIAADWGLGLRFNLDFILLRFDMGFKVHAPARPDGSRWLTPRQWFAPDGSAFHFGVGYPF